MLPTGEARELERIAQDISAAGYFFFCPDVKRALYDEGIVGLSAAAMGVALASPSGRWRTGQVAITGGVGG